MIIPIGVAIAMAAMMSHTAIPLQLPKRRREKGENREEGGVETKNGKLEVITFSRAVSGEEVT